jgi:hypothetical protein
VSFEESKWGDTISWARIVGLGSRATTITLLPQIKEDFPQSGQKNGKRHLRRVQKTGWLVTALQTLMHSFLYLALQWRKPSIKNYCATRDSVVVEALCYEMEGRGLETR